MPVKKRRSKVRTQGDLTEAELAWLHGRPAPPDRKFEYQAITWPGEAGALSRPGRPSAEELWAQFGEEVIAEWVQEHPGTMPPRWHELGDPAECQ
jgi:hypothetical protein